MKENLDVTFRIISLCFHYVVLVHVSEVLGGEGEKDGSLYRTGTAKAVFQDLEGKLSQYSIQWFLFFHVTAVPRSYLQIKLSKLSPFLNTKEGLRIASPFFRSSKDKGRQKPRVTKEVPDSLMKGELRR